MQRLSVIIGVIALLSGASGAQQSQPASHPSAAELNAGSLARLRDRYEVSIARHQQSLESLEDLRQKIRKESGLVEATPETIHQIAAHLQEQREALEVEDAGAAGRRVGIEEAIARVSDDAKKRAATDEVSAEIEKVVELRQKKVDRYRNAAKENVSESERETVESELAAARAELAAARQSGRRTGGRCPGGVESRTAQPLHRDPGTPAEA